MSTPQYGSPTQVPDDIGASLKIMAACILIFSIYRIKHLLKKVKSDRISTREAIMTWHTICYVLVIVLNIYDAWVSQALVNNMLNQTICRLYVSASVANIVKTFLYQVILILFYYMAAKFCKPIENYGLTQDSQNQ